MNHADKDSTENSRVRIVVAEDEALIRMDLVEMLKEAGYEVLAEAADGAHAIELVKEFKPDLAILDVKMPILDGISAAEEIISYCPVLMLTAFSQIHRKRLPDSNKILAHLTGEEY